jgi:hypothetical protein
MHPAPNPELDRGFLAKLRELYGCGIDVPCPTCRYNLRGLASRRCPECGRPVGDLLRLADTNPDRLRAMIRAQRRLALWRAAKAIAAVAVTAAIASLAWLLLR